MLLRKSQTSKTQHGPVKCTSGVLKIILPGLPERSENLSNGKNDYHEPPDEPLPPLLKLPPDEPELEDPPPPHELELDEDEL